MLHYTLLPVSFGLMFLANLSASAYSFSGELDPYVLPKDKSTITLCRAAALSLHPGSVEKIEVKSTQKGLHYRFEIKQRDGSEWVVVCDTATAQIISDQSKEW